MVEREVQQQLKLAESLDRLYKNDDFKAVILDRYLHDEPLRITELLSFDDKNREKLFEQLISIGNFGYYLENIKSDGYSAAQYIRDYEEGEEND